MTRDRKIFLLALAVPFGLVVWGASMGLRYVLKTRAAHRTNYGGRRTVAVDTVVIHTTEGTAASAVSWFAQDHAKFKDAKGQPMRPSSAHYVVAKDGTVTSMVPEDFIAWHASDSAVNGRSIGIECEGAAANAATWTPALMASLVALSAKLALKYGIPATRGKMPGFIGHSDVPAAVRLQGKVDPGPHFPWADYLDRVRAASLGVA